MKIELCEDNGFLSADGKPTLVVLVVTSESGKVIRVPYSANKRISDLYKEIRQIKITEDIKMIEDFVNKEDSAECVGCVGTNICVIPEEPVKAPQAENHNVIEREDIVKCVKFNHSDGADPIFNLLKGQEYRVINIIKEKGAIVCYEVLDDKANSLIRMPAFPDEIELVRKAVRGAPRKQVFEITKRCVCGETVALMLEGDKYVGKCEKCREELKENRKK